MLNILQSDVQPETMVALTTKDQLKPGRIVKIILPKQPEGVGWITVKFAICKRKFRDAVTPAEAEDITEQITGSTEIYLPADKEEFEVDFKVNKYYWWFVIFVKNKMTESQFITCQVRIENVET